MRILGFDPSPLPQTKHESSPDDKPGGVANVVDVGTCSGGGDTDDSATVETPAEINERNGGVRTEDTESSEEE